MPVSDSVSSRSTGSAYADGIRIVSVISLNAEVGNVKNCQRHIPLIT
jgi:hypothetical protein